MVPGGNVGDWRQLKSDHSDPADLAFTPGNTEPLMLATDGGVHLTKDQGKQWTKDVTLHTMVHENMKKIIDGFQGG